MSGTTNRNLQGSLSSKQSVIGKVLTGQTSGTNIIPDNYHDVSCVTAADGDVLEGKIYVDSDGTVTEGTMANIGAVDKSLDVTNVTYTIQKGYHDGNGKVEITLESKTATPTKSVQKITPTSGEVLSEVTIEAIPDTYQNVTNVNATAGDVLEGKTIVNSSGEVINGSIKNNGSIKATIDGLSVTSYTIPAGNHDGTGEITMTNDIELQLASI